MSITERFQGTWELQEWSVTLDNEDKARLPFGGRVSGHILYSPQGWMSATLMALGRPPVSQDRRIINDLARRLQSEGGDANEPQDAQLLSQYFLAAQGYISYCGPYSADSEQVYHHVHASLIPQWVGTTLTRRHTFAADDARLVLEAANEGARDTLVWQRVTG